MVSALSSAADLVVHPRPGNSRPHRTGGPIGLIVGAEAERPTAQNAGERTDWGIHVELGCHCWAKRSRRRRPYHDQRWRRYRAVPDTLIAAGTLIILAACSSSPGCPPCPRQSSSRADLCRTAEAGVDGQDARAEGPWGDRHGGCSGSGVAKPSGLGILQPERPLEPTTKCVSAVSRRP